MPNPELTLVYVLIDGSGSMVSMRKAVVDGFNEFITDQKKIPGNVLLNITQFNSTWNGKLNFKPLQHFKDLREISNLTMENYNPSGGTPLLAAMSTAISELGKDLAAMPENERPAKVLFMTITDGEENTSDRTKFSRSGVNAMVSHQTNVYDWQFLYLGANQDSFSEAGGMGYTSYNTSNFTYTHTGFVNAMYAASASAGNYRSFGSTLNLSSMLSNIENKADSVTIDPIGTVTANPTGTITIDSMKKMLDTAKTTATDKVDDVD